MKKLLLKDMAGRKGSKCRGFYCRGSSYTGPCGQLVWCICL